MATAFIFIYSFHYVASYLNWHNYNAKPISKTKKKNTFRPELDFESVLITIMFSHTKKRKTKKKEEKYKLRLTQQNTVDAHKFILRH